MKRLLFIARFEYLRYVTQRGFLLGTFLVPLLMVGAFIFIVAALIWVDPVENAIGYVDQANVINDEAIEAHEAEANSFSFVPLIAYSDEDRAHAAFLEGEVELYIIIPSDYLDTGTVTAYGHERISDAGEQSVRNLLRSSLLVDVSPYLAMRLRSPMANLNHRSLDESRSASRRDFLPFLLPFAFGLLFSSATLASSGYLLQAIIEEKENRTMELIITSVTPEQLLGGKTVGLGALGLTRALIWFLPGAALAMAVTRLTGSSPINLPHNFVLVAIPTFISGYLLYAGLMVTIGAMVTSIQEGQQMASFISLFSAMPFMLNFVFLTNPNGPIAVGMSLFPLSAPLALIMRLPVAQIPAWQIVLSLSILTATAVLVVLGAAHIFRAGMLQYGKAIKVRELPGILRESLKRRSNEARNPL